MQVIHPYRPPPPLHLQALVTFVFSGGQGPRKVSAGSSHHPPSVYSHSSLTPLQVVLNWEVVLSSEWKCQLPGQLLQSVPNCGLPGQVASSLALAKASRFSHWRGEGWSCLAGQSRGPSPDPLPTAYGFCKGSHLRSPDQVSSASECGDPGRVTLGWSRQVRAPDQEKQPGGVSVLSPSRPVLQVEWVKSLHKVGLLF